MTGYLFILVGAVLVNNVVLVRILGLCPFMGVSKKLETALGMGAAPTFVLTLGCGTSYVIDHWLLLPNDLQYLRTLSFIVTFAAIRERLEGADIPLYFRGNAIALITGGLMSLAFMGFAGLDKFK